MRKLGKLTRVGIIARELKSLGFYKYQVAKLLHVNHSYVSQATLGESDWPDGRRVRGNSPAARAVALMHTRPDDFPTVESLATAVGSTPGSLKILLWRHEEANFRDLKRGFAVPRSLQKEFTRLRVKGLSERQAAEALGLIPRGEGSLTTGEALKARAGLDVKPLVTHD